MFVLFNIPGTMIVGFLVSRFVAPVGCSVLGSLWAGIGDVGVAGVKEIKFDDPKVTEKPKVLKSDKKLECVFVKVGNKAKIRIIKTGIQDDSNIEVITGLKKGDVVITGPYSTVSKDLNSGDKFTTDKEDKK